MEIRDISNQAVRDELVEKYGRLAVPTIIIGKRRILGFEQNEAEIRRLLGVNKAD